MSAPQKPPFPLYHQVTNTHQPSSETNAISPETPTTHPASANPYHQAVISSTGPSIPPRHSSLNRGFLFGNSSRKHIPLPVKMPSLSSLRGSKKNVDAAEGTVNMNPSPADHDAADMVPLRTLQNADAGDGPKTSETAVPRNVPLPNDQDKVPPREIVRKAPATSKPGPRTNGAHEE